MLRSLLLAERQRHATALEQAALQVQTRDQQIDRLTAIIKELQRHRFGRRSEQLDGDQLALALEEVEQTLSAVEAAEDRSQAAKPDKPARQCKVNRGALPLHLPREEVVLDVADKSCACCGGLKLCIGEDDQRGVSVSGGRHPPGRLCGLACLAADSFVVNLMWRLAVLLLAELHKGRTAVTHRRH